MIKLVENIGYKYILLFSSFYKELHFNYSCFIQTIKLKNYTPTTVNILIEQIYIMAITVIPIFLMIAIIFGGIIFSSIINIMLEYKLDNFIQYFISFIISDFTPSFTALLILLRSSVKVNTEISILKLNNKLENNVLTNVFIPRILSGIISSTLLSIFFITIMLISLYISTYLHPYIDLNTLNNLLLNFVNPIDILLLICKSIIFGFILIVIPIYSGLKSTSDYISNGILKLFVIIFVGEILTLLLKL